MNLTWQAICELVYGTRTSPVTGKQIPSSEFGTLVHKEIELQIEAMMSGEEREDNPWTPYAMPFIEWLQDEGIEPHHTELIVYNDDIMIAGSVDFVGRRTDGSLVMADYKCRANCKGKVKKYDKDCRQLAIEAWMLNTEAATLPECITVCIDCDTGTHYHHTWSDKDVVHGITAVKLCAALFWHCRMG